MPSTSKKQAKFMAAAAHNPAFAKKVGISQDVAKEFNQADKGRKFRSGGMATNKLKSLFKGKESYAEELKEAKAIKSGKITPQQYARGEKMEGHCGGGKIKKMASGGRVKRYEDGGDVEAPTNENTPTAASAQFKNFKDAFKSARASGDKTFEWEGKKYTTEMAKPEPSFAQKAKKAGFTSAETKGGAALMTRKMASGGSVRGCGIAQRGKTKGRMV